MPPKKKRKKEDMDRTPHCASKHLAKEDRNNAKGIIYCTNSKETLSSLPLSQSWKMTLEAAKIRGHKSFLEIAESLESEKDFPNTQYHNWCKKVYTHSGTLERISNER